ncbi:CatB-related O-acetyltransferase [Vibrio fluvialis]|nr:CatB-related O-acetyltransferase [Vibrio fluvialis]
MHCTIGKFCSISWGVTIGAGEHDYNKITTHDFLYNTGYDINDGKVSYDRFKDNLSIGNDVWIGTNATICRGVTVGDGAVIGANSVVTKDVPPYAIVVGSPARVLKYRFDDKIIALLMDLKWWDLPPELIKEKFELMSSSNIEDIINELKLEK